MSDGDCDHNCRFHDDGYDDQGDVDDVDGHNNQVDDDGHDDYDNCEHSRFDGLCQDIRSEVHPQRIDIHGRWVRWLCGTLLLKGPTEESLTTVRTRIGLAS